MLAQGSNNAMLTFAMKAVRDTTAGTRGGRGVVEGAQVDKIL